MSRRLSMVVLVMLFSICISFSGRVVAQDKQDKGNLQSFINKVINAHGGSERLARVKAQTWSDKGVYHGASGASRPFTGSYAMEIPGKVKMEIKDAFVIILNGNKGWMNGKEMTPEQITQQSDTAYIGWVTTRFPLKDPSLTVTWIDETEVDGRPAIGLKVAGKGHRDIKIYFDASTGLMAKCVTIPYAPRPGGAEIEQETYFSDYKDHDGIPVPMKYRVKQKSKLVMEGEFIQWQGVEALDEKYFKPE